jgi:hypothetical protein
MTKSGREIMEISRCSTSRDGLVGGAADRVRREDGRPGSVGDF